MTKRQRKGVVALLLAAFVAASLPLGARAQGTFQPTAPKGVQIDRNGLIILVKSTLIALDQANKTGNYSVLRDLAAPGFAAANNPARLAEIFANLRRDKVDLSGVLVLEPQLSVLPELVQNGMMHFAGFFPSAPAQINFEMIFAPVDGQWRLFGLGANIGSSGPVAPAPPPAPEQKKPKSEKPKGEKP
jgi:hypothetical protein